MPIPNYVELLLPYMKIVNDGKVHGNQNIIKLLADSFNLSTEERESSYKTGNSIFNNKVGWAKSKLIEAGYIERSGRGLLKITKHGLEIMKNSPPKIDSEFLRNNSAKIKCGIDDKSSTSIPLISEDNLTPVEHINRANTELRNALADELLERILQSTPTFFERLVIDLLVAMGYGGSREDAAKHLGKAGDEGIDGLIKQDKLGLDYIVIQAKRYSNTKVSAEDVYSFAGSMDKRNSPKGVFITTSDYTKPCFDFVKNCHKKIVLINGKELTNLMIDFGIGVSPMQTIEIKQIDNDYFDDLE